MSMPSRPPPEPLPRQDDRVGAPYYVVLPTPGGWQLLIEHGDRYLRWVLRGRPGHPGLAWPDTDVAAASLELPGGALHGKPALEREGVEVGQFHDLRTHLGRPVALGESLEQGVLELEFDGPTMRGRWQLTRSGQTRRETETWTLRPLESLE